MDGTIDFIAYLRGIPVRLKLNSVELTGKVGIPMPTVYTVCLDGKGLSPYDYDLVSDRA